MLLITLIRAAERGGKEVSNVLKNKNFNSIAKGKTKEGKDELLTQGDLKSHQMMVLQVSAKFPGLKIISEEKDAPESDGYFLPFGELQDLLYADDIHNLPSSQVNMENIVIWIDPLDATQEYTENLTQFVTTMACVAVNGVATIGVIHEPFTGETYWAWKDYGLSDSLEDIIINYRDKVRKKSSKLRFIVSRSHAGDIKREINKVYKKDYDMISAGGSGYKIIQLIKGNADAYIHKTAIKKWDICAPNALINSIPEAPISSAMTDLEGNSINYTDNGDVFNEKGILATVRIDHGELLKSLSGLKIEAKQFIQT